MIVNNDSLLESRICHQCLAAVPPAYYLYLPTVAPALYLYRITTCGTSFASIAHYIIKALSDMVGELSAVIYSH